MLHHPCVRSCAGFHRAICQWLALLSGVMPAALCTVLLLVASTVSHAGPLAPWPEIALWGSATPPGSAGLALVEQAQNRGDAHHPDRMITGVGVPSLIPFIPEKANGLAVIVAPGGGYTKLAIDKEGADITRWLNSRGITAFVLKYRLPDEGHVAGRMVPLQDGQRAIRLVRAMAGRWHVDPARIGIMGFSAGGHLAAASGLHFERKLHEPLDDIDKLSARPDFMALLYAAAGFAPRPGASGRPESSLAWGEYATDAPVAADATPAFIMIAGDDPRVPADRNVNLWLALRRAGVPAELHVMARGGHAFALLDSAAESVRDWPRSFEVWLRAIGMLPPAIPSLPPKRND